MDEANKVLDKLANLRPEVLEYLIKKVEEEKKEAEEKVKQEYLEEIRKFIPELEGFNREMSIDELKQLLEYLKAGNYQPRTVKSMDGKRIKIPKLGRGWIVILGLGIAALLFYLVRVTFLG